MENIVLDTEHHIENIIRVKELIKEQRYEEACDSVLKLLEIPYSDDSFILELLVLHRQCQIARYNQLKSHPVLMKYGKYRTRHRASH